MTEHQGIFFADGPAGRRARLRRGPDVWEVITTLEANDGSVRVAAEVLDIPESDIRDALAYYGDHPAEIDEWIRMNDEEALRVKAAWHRQRAIARE